MQILDVLRASRAALAAAGLALLLGAAWTGASAYTEPRAERSIERELLWTEEASYVYGVPVTRNSTHIPIGTLLPMGQPAYFRTISDALLLEHRWFAAPGVAGIAPAGVAAARMSVHVDAVTPDGRPYWSIEHKLAEGTTRDLAAGIALSARLDLDALVAEYAEVDKQLPVSDGHVNWTIRTVVTYAFDLRGRHVEGTVEHVLPFQVQDPRILAPGPEDLAWRTPHTEEQVHVSSAPRGMPGVLSSPRVLGLAGLGLALLLLPSTLAPRGDAADAYERERRRYRDWVSTAGGIPATTGPVVDVHTLEDLVHVASDARTRVLLDPATRVFYALLPSATYRYARHETRPS